MVEVVELTDDWFEVNICFVEELVPIELVDGFDVLLPHFDELLLEFTLNLTNASSFEVRQIIGDDLGAQGRNRIRHEGATTGHTERFLIHNITRSSQ